MAQEEHTQRCSNSSSGGGGGVGGAGNNNRSSKKWKEKKAPQRGLGVAQLEKIRLEEQQKKDVRPNILSPNLIISPSNSSSCLPIQCPNFRHTLSSNSIPLSPPLPNNLHPIPNIDVSSDPNVGSGEIGWPGISEEDLSNWPKLWNGECKLQGDNHGLDHGEFAFRTNVSLSSESNTPIWHLPNIMHRSKQFQQTCSSSMVNVSTVTSSSVMNFQMEPPSNQRYCGNNYTPLWPEEDKVVGMKRSYPFSLENVPIPSFHCKLPSTYVSPISRSDESASCSNGGTTSIEPANPVFREGPSSSTAMSVPNPKKVIDENEGLNGDFLTLAPPETAQSHLSSKQKWHLSPNLSPHSQELPQFETLSHQGSTRDPIHLPEQPPFLSLFPSAKTYMVQAVTTISNSSGEAGESVDLNLKL